MDNTPTLTSYEEAIAPWNETDGEDYDYLIPDPLDRYD